jgi:hypothetical protein
VYRLVAALSTFTAPVSVLGDGHAQSVILVDTAFSGDVFSWSETGGDEGDGLGASLPPADRARVEIEGVRIVGNRTTTRLQNAFVFYDRADRVLMQNVDVFYMTGSALHSGVTQRTSQASMTRSQFYSLRFFNCYFVTSTAAPVASGWSGCRVGLAPTGKRRLTTAHTRSRHFSRPPTLVISACSNS